MLLKSEQKMFNTKTVRELIFKGAERDAKNSEGLKPCDMIDKIEDEQIKAELSKILGDQPCYMPCFHVKQPLKKLEKSKLTMFSYFGMMATALLLVICFVFPYSEPSYYMTPVLIMFMFSSFFFGWASIKDPGYIKKSQKLSFLRLNKYFDPSYICPTCEVLRPQESRHCYICNKCVDRFDHHC